MDLSPRWFAARLLFGPTLLWNLLLGRVLKVRHWWDPVDDTVVLGALPLPRDVSALARLGIRGVVNTCEEYAGPENEYREHGMEQLRIPVIDYSPPAFAQLREGVEFIERWKRKGGKVYVHCKAGRGRSATVALCWIIKSRRLSPSDAMELLASRRVHVNRHIRFRREVARFYAELTSTGGSRSAYRGGEASSSADPEAE